MLSKASWDLAVLWFSLKWESQRYEVVTVLCSLNRDVIYDAY
jgi:hypothetical protein